MLYSRAWYRKLQYSTPQCHAWFQTSSRALYCMLPKKLPIDQAKMCRRQLPSGTQRLRIAIMDRP